MQDRTIRLSLGNYEALSGILIPWRPSMVVGHRDEIMVYWSLARAGLRLTPGTAVNPAFPGPRGGEHTTCQAKC